MYYLDEENEDNANDVMPEEANSSEEENQDESALQSSKQSGSKSNVVKDQAREQINKRVAERVKKEGAQKVLTKMGSTKLMSLLAPILPYLAIAALIILFIIAMIGIIMFLLMLPGVMMGQINEFLDKAGAALAKFWEGDAEAMVETEDIVSVANYLENMGYDLKNYGFVTSPVTNATYNGYGGDKNKAFIDSNGIGRTSKEITNINSEVIRTYLISDNYVYCCKNFEKNVKTAFSSLGTFLYGLFGDDIGWGNGLIGIYRENDSILSKLLGYDGVGQAGASYGRGPRNLIDFVLKIKNDLSYDIDVDAEQKTLTIESKSMLGFGRSRSFTYNLDGWTARYGMPIEFLLAVHLTSMSPDLAVDLATAFDTDVSILLHETKASIDAAYKTESGSFVEQDSIKGLSAKEIFETTGITSPSSCTRENENCSTATKDGTLDSVCDECKSYIDSIKSDLNTVATNKDVSTFVPYIASVTDHWFRDVYFVAEKGTDVILNDSQYEEKTKERWTDYESEKDENGNVISYTLYRLNDDGTYGDKWNGTKEEADKQGIKVAKKAKTNKIEDIAEDGTMQDGGFLKSDYWAAYKYQETQDSWTQYAGQAEDGGDAAGLSNPDNIYYKLGVSSNVTQIQDAQRGVTNTKIKQIFSTNKYYMYDGTKQRAELIEKDREKTKNKRKNDNTENDARDPNLIGTFSVTRDSLTAFNILKNMNTFDSDSIYRDFKELIVELNYFDKEDLTAEPTDTWEWPIPEAGSGGWPVRRFEKSEDVYGTLIDSKVNLDNLKATAEASVNVKGSGRANAPITDNKPTKNNANSQQSLVEEKNVELQSIDGTLGNTTSIAKQLEATGSIGSGATGPTGSGSDTKYHKGTLLETGTACWQEIVNGGYVYWKEGTPIPPVGTGHIDCSSFVSWILYEYGYDDFGGGQHCTGDFMTQDYKTAYGWEIIDVAAGENCKDKLQAGDILVRDDGGGEGAHGHVQFIYSIEPDGTVLTYDCGDTSHWVKENENGYASDFYADSRPGRIIRIENPQNNGETYEGYEPYQDVVSPITGEIIEAGKTNIKNIQTGVDEEVGYVKIRALEKADMESYFNTDKEGYEGYKYFYEEYEQAGVKGYILYIEGFDLRTVDESLTLQKNDETIWENGEDNVRNSYTKNKYDDVLSADIKEALEEKEKKREEALATVLTSDGKLFVKEGTVLGKTYTDGDVEKADNSNGNDGTNDIPDDAVERPGIKDIPEEKRKVKNVNNGEEVDAPNGNYIRLILRSNEDGAEATQNKDSIIENVEDYLELDDGSENMQELDMEKFLYWLGVYIEGGDLDSTGTKSIAKVLGQGDNHITHFFGLTECEDDLDRKLGYAGWSTAAGQEKDLTELVDVFLALIEEQKASIKKELGEDISDGYLQAFISVLHNYGNLTNRGTTYKANKQVSEGEWTAYSGRFAEALIKRRKSEWKIITEGRYTKAYDNPDEDLEFTSETPFTDWCKEHGVTNIQVKTVE